jgi:hypothetical protein
VSEQVIQDPLLSPRCLAGRQPGQVHLVGGYPVAGFDPRDCVLAVADARGEMDSHFLAVFTPVGPVGRDGEKHEPIAES